MRPVAEEFTAAVVERGRQAPGRRPADGTTSTSARSSARPSCKRFHEGLVEPSIAAGAKLATGGTYDGLFYRPTVLTGVTPEMPVFTEEIFGPVMPITVVDSEAEALDLVNRPSHVDELGLHRATRCAASPSPKR